MEFENFMSLTKYEKVQHFNNSLFENEDVFYVFVDEMLNGELYFLANVSIKNKNISYEYAYKALHANKFVSGDPIMELLEEQLPHLLKYEVTTKYKFELLQ